MRVLDIMTEKVHTLRDSDSIEHAADVLSEFGITAAPVVNAAGRVVGIIGEGDLLWRRMAGYPGTHEAGVPARPKLVAEVMSAEPVTVTPQLDVGEAAKKMIYYNVRSIPVMDGDDLVGIVSRRDVVRSVIRTDETLTREVQERLDAYSGGPRRWRGTVVDSAATIEGSFDDATERTVVEVMARTVPGVAEARLTDAPPRGAAATDVGYDFD